MRICASHDRLRHEKVNKQTGRVSEKHERARRHDIYIKNGCQHISKYFCSFSSCSQKEYKHYDQIKMNEVEFPVLVPLVAKQFNIRWYDLIFISLVNTVQLDKEDCIIL